MAVYLLQVFFLDCVTLKLYDKFMQYFFGAANSFWPNDGIWWHGFGSALVQVMAWCHQATNCYLGQCWTNTALSSEMMMSSNGTIFRITGPLCREFTGPGEFPVQWPVTWSFDVFFDLHLNKRLSKQPWGWWFETPPWSLWRQCNGCAATFTWKQFHKKCPYIQFLTYVQGLCF